MGLAGGGEVETRSDVSVWRRVYALGQSGEHLRKWSGLGLARIPPAAAVVPIDGVFTPISGC